MFKARRKIENQYYNSLLKIVERIEEIIDKTYDPDNPTSITNMVLKLKAYANTLTPWAKQLAEGLISQVNTYNLKDWEQISDTMASYFKDAYKGKDPVFVKAKALQNAEVKLIKSLPLQAAKRAQLLSRRYVAGGYRHEDLANVILNTSSIVKHRAKCIARTEIAKANTMLVAARAESINADKFIWRTAEDEIVRPAHAALNGKVFSFNDPPLVKGEGRHLPGDFPNCRCYPEPILDKAKIPDSNK